MINPNSPNHQQRSLNECNPNSPPVDVNLDPAPPFCSHEPDDNKRRVNDNSLNYLKDQTMKKTGFGARADCDPMQKGYIINDLEHPDRQHIYRYSKSLRGTDEAIKDMFNNIVVIDEDGKAWPIPCILGPPEKAVAAIVQENVRKDETLVVDRLKLPLLGITQTSMEFDVNRYTYHKAINLFRDRHRDGHPGFTINEKYNRDTVFGLARGIPINVGYTVTAWTMYREDINQIIEQILSKFSLAAYIRVTGVPWEIIVKLDSIANNLDAEPGDAAIRVIKYEFNITVETYIPQPIERKKAVLSMKVDFVDGITDHDFQTIMATIEESVKELEC